MHHPLTVWTIRCGMFSLLCFLFSAFRVSEPFLCEPPSFFHLLLFCRVSHIFPFRLLAASSMARSKITPNPPPSPRNLPTKNRRTNPSSSRDPPRDSNVPSDRVARPASSRPSQSQPNPPQPSAMVRPLPDYKQLYPWASATLLGETSSINSDRDILRLKKGNPLLTFLSVRNTTTRCLCTLAPW